MQLKSEANTEPRKRFHMMSRLKKAVGHAELLAFLCEIDKCDARTKLEVQVRALILFCDYNFFLHIMYVCLYYQIFCMKWSLLIILFLNPLYLSGFIW